ncbi:MAG TPA: LLM class F420-dependent oxidoreductase [Anaerolineae bacterium]
MRIGVTYPQTEYGHDPIAVRDYAQTAEALGFTHIEAYDHVLGANPDRPGGWKGPYTHESVFLEPFVLFGYLTGFTRVIEFITGVIILPQRQTALVAKQAATLDVLCGGRLRLGVGIGWNEVEYVALNQDFHTRGRRIGEQIALMRQLWTQPLVTFAGTWHTVVDAGLNPLPIQRPIPVWFGGHADAAIRRAARIGDGWMPNYPDTERARPGLDLFDRTLAEAGRARADIAFRARVPYGKGDPGVWTALIRDWETAGATHVTLNTLGSGFTRPADHLAALRRFAEAVGLSKR